MNAREPSGTLLHLGRAALFVVLLLAWHVLTATGVLPPFFFGTPFKVFRQIWIWVSTGTIWPHLAITLLETLLAFFGGTILGFILGLWLGLKPTASALLSPYLKAFNAMPRLILAPIFAVWFGLGILSKVALGISIVFFLVFFNVFHGIREVNPTVLANARMIGASPRQLLRMVYIPSAATWVFASLHNAVGMAFVGAVIGEYLGSVKGIGYLILEAEGIFDIDAVLAGVIVLTICAYILDVVVTIVERHLLRWQAH
jgi:NitT/TauT family transport system permease protein